MSYRVLIHQNILLRKKNRSAIKKAKKKIQKKEIYKAERSIIRNSIILYDNRSTMINAFVTRDILLEDVEEDEYLDENQNMKKVQQKEQKGEDKINQKIT